jgi:hypothetical protein
MHRPRFGLLAGVVVATLLVVSGLLPHPIAASPYETSPPAPYFHQTVGEDDRQFDQLVERYGFDPEADAVDGDSLSPTARTVVERSLAADRAAGGWRRYDLPVCATGMVVCDSVRDPPAAFHYGEGTPAAVFSVIVVDGERYLLQTGVQTDARGGDDPRNQPLSTYTWLGGLLPFGVLVLAGHAVGRAVDRHRVADALTVGGAGLLAVGIAVPYLTVFGILEYDTVAGALFAGSVAAAGLAAGVVVWLTVRYTSETESARRRRGE